MNGVKLPRSSPLLLAATKWLAMRLSSTMISRKCRVFSETVMPQQLLDAQRPAEIHAHAGQVVEAVGVGQELPRREVFADLLGAAVQIADVRRHLGDQFAVGPQHHAQHAVRAGMLRTHADEHFVRANVEFDGFGMDSLGLHGSISTGIPWYSAGIW